MSEQIARRRDAYRYIVLIGLAIIVVCYLIIAGMRPSVGTGTVESPFRKNRTKFRQIITALHSYHSRHGSLPYSDMGPDHALYAIRNDVDVSCFDLEPIGDKATYASWDDDRKCLLNSSLEYLNEPGVSLPSSQVIMMSKPSRGEFEVLLGWADGILSYREFFKTPDRRVLGCRITVDDLLVAGSDLFREMSDTHVFAGHPWTSTTHSGSGGEIKISATVAGNQLVYRYSLGRLTGCTINGVIEETFELDDVDRVIGLARRPDNWRELLHNVPAVQDSP